MGTAVGDAIGNPTGDLMGGQWGSQLVIEWVLSEGRIELHLGEFPKRTGLDCIWPQMNAQCTYNTPKSSHIMGHFRNVFRSMDGSNEAKTRNPMRHLMGYSAPSEAASFEGYATKMVT